MSSMNQFETYVRDSQETALDTLCEAEREITTRMDDGENLSVPVATYAAARAYAGWWNWVVTEIDQAGADPVDALCAARESARRTLTDQSSPRRACPFAQGFAVADVEASRRFYADTAHLEALAVPSGRRAG